MKKKQLKAKETLELFGYKFKTEIVVELKDHVYDCGEKGESIDTITYTVKVPKGKAWQPSVDEHKNLLELLNNATANEFDAYVDACHGAN